MKNWSDDEFLEFLMTSDFEDNLSPEELKSLLLKFRYFFRIVSTRQNNIEIEKKKFDFKLEQLNLKLEETKQTSNSQIGKLTKIYESLLTRKLTFKERFFGRIKPKPNEIV